MKAGMEKRGVVDKRALKKVNIIHIFLSFSNTSNIRISIPIPKEEEGRSKKMPGM